MMMYGQKDTLGVSFNN